MPLPVHLGHERRPAGGAKCLGEDLVQLLQDRNSLTQEWRRKWCLVSIRLPDAAKGDGLGWPPDSQDGEVGQRSHERHRLQKP